MMRFLRDEYEDTKFGRIRIICFFKFPKFPGSIMKSHWVAFAKSSPISVRFFTIDGSGLGLTGPNVTVIGGDLPTGNF